MDRQYEEEDKQMSKYIKELENYKELCFKFLSERYLLYDIDIIFLLDIFYEKNKPDIHELLITTRSNYTRIQIVNTVSKNIIINIADDSLTNGLIRAVGRFIQWQNEELKPSL